MSPSWRGKPGLRPVLKVARLHDEEEEARHQRTGDAITLSPSRHLGHENRLRTARWPASTASVQWGENGVVQRVDVNMARTDELNLGRRAMAREGGQSKR